MLFHAFDNCNSLTLVTIPDSVTSIEYKAFFNCISLTSITIPKHFESRIKEIFYGVDTTKVEITYI